MQETVLAPLHEELGARFVDFYGYRMPVSYTSIMEEHRAVREHAGLFDLCHMARFMVTGPDRDRLVSRIVTNDVAGLAEGGAHYGLMCAEDGGVIDDLIYYRLEDALFVVGNASNRSTDREWLEGHAVGLEAGVADVSDTLAMVALQGARSAEVLAGVCDADLAALPYYAIIRTTINGVDLLLARTGYTGEDGFELYLPAEAAIATWRYLAEAGAEQGVVPCGLGARDTLRTEAAMPLYGHELGPEVNPLEAGLGMFVQLDKPGGFIGRDALARIKAEKPARRLVCFELDGRRPARHGDQLLDAAGGPWGKITSGTFSPTLQRPIGMALVTRRRARPGTPIIAKVRGRRLSGCLVKRPFYKRTS